MRTLRYTYWPDWEYFLGYLNDYPEYETQALSKEDLMHNPTSLLEDIGSVEVPYVRKVDDLVVALGADLHRQQREEMDYPGQLGVAGTCISMKASCVCGRHLRLRQ